LQWRQRLPRREGLRNVDGTGTNNTIILIGSPRPTSFFQAGREGEARDWRELGEGMLRGDDLI